MRLSEVSLRLAERYGFRITNQRQVLMEHAVQRRSSAHQFDSPDDYLDWLTASAGDDEWNGLIDDLTIKETSFFRNPDQFRALERHILPELIERKSRERVTRSWNDPPSLTLCSAACATGDEAYSIAMCVFACLPYRGAWNVRIDAFDVSQAAVETARRGQYSLTDRTRAATNLVNPDYIDRCFRRTESGDYEVVPSIRRMLNFRTANLISLMRRPIEQRYDIMFCRNVMIYFDYDDQATLVRFLENSLKPGGYLFLGDAEALHLYGHHLAAVTEFPCLVYRKPFSAHD